MSTRYVDVEYMGKRARLYFTMNAMLDIEEQYDASISEIFKGTNREVFERECYAISRMSYEGKALFPSEDLDGLSISELSLAMPYEINMLADSMFNAITLGLKREVEPEVVDEGLLELKKKSIKVEQNEPNILEQENELT